MIDVRTTVWGRVSHIPYEKIARAVLGARYELSLVICGDHLALRMNKEYRHKTYFPNVLSFPLSKTEGEIFLNVRKAEREARALGVSVRERLALLFVHGLFHLNGLNHGPRMESLEQSVLKKYGFR